MTLRRRAKFFLYNSVPGFAGRFPYHGSQVYFPPGAPVFRVICETGSFEADVIDRLVRLARPQTTVFDVGANIGLMAIPVLRACDTCRVISFEPSPNSLPFLRQTASQAGYGDRWILVDQAVSSSAGELDFTIGDPDDALFEGFKSGERIAGARTITVPVTTLDDQWRALGTPPVSVVKIDVEGAEWAVLQGGMELFRRGRPAVLLEWHEPYLDRFATPWRSLLAFANDRDYQVFTVPHGVHVADEMTLRVQLWTCQNFLLLPRGAP